MGTVFLSILNQVDFHLVQNRKENCHISFNLKGNGILVFSVHGLDVEPFEHHDDGEGFKGRQRGACREALVSRVAVVIFFQPQL